MEKYKINYNGNKKNNCVEVITSKLLTDVKNNVNCTNKIQVPASVVIPFYALGEIVQANYNTEIELQVIDIIQERICNKELDIMDLLFNDEEEQSKHFELSENERVNKLYNIIFVDRGGENLTRIIDIIHQEASYYKIKLDIKDIVNGTSIINDVYPVRSSMLYSSYAGNYDRQFEIDLYRIEDLDISFLTFTLLYPKEPYYFSDKYIDFDKVDIFELIFDNDICYGQNITINDTEFTIYCNGSEEIQIYSDNLEFELYGSYTLEEVAEEIVIHLEDLE
jgi:hypothetical protein